MFSWIVRLNRKFSLQHNADLPPEPCGVNLGNIEPIDKDLATLRDVETLHEFRQGRLA